MATVAVLVCDHCGTMEDVLNYDILWDGDGKAHLDLCAEGRKPMDELLKLREKDAPEPAATPAPRRRSTARRVGGRTGVTKVTSMAEIEAQKKG